MNKLIFLLFSLMILFSSSVFAAEYEVVKQCAEELELSLNNDGDLECIIGETLIIMEENDVLTNLAGMGAAIQAASLKEAADKALEKKDYDTTNKLLALLKSSLKVLNGETKPIFFDDVDSNSWYYDAVVYSVSNGIFKGMSDSRFAPNMEITRGMFLTLMERMYNNSSIVYEKNYKDVSEDAYYSNAVKWAKAKGILPFVTDEYFYPNKPITREELVTVLRGSMMAAGLDGDYMIQMKSFSDSTSISQWAKDSVTWAMAKKVVTGFEDGSFRPQSTATRAQVAQIFYNQRKGG